MTRAAYLRRLVVDDIEQDEQEGPQASCSMLPLTLMSGAWLSLTRATTGAPWTS